MGNDNPLVSICCLAYNHAPYIRQCLDGFVMQKTNFPFEVLIHDDASTDRTADIIRGYEAKYPDIIKPIYQSENQHKKGTGILQNIVFPITKGKYIALCEGDDYWTDSCKLQKQVDFMEANPEYSMCFHFADVVYENGKKTDYILYEDLEEREYTANEIVENWIVPTASVLFQTKFSKNIKWDQRFTAGDIVLFLSMAQCGKIFCLGDKMSIYRRLDSGVTLSRKREIDSMVKRINHLEAIKEHFPNIDEKIVNEYIVSPYVALFFKYLARLNYKCLGCIYKGMILNPALFIKIFLIKLKFAMKNQVVKIRHRQ